MKPGEISGPINNGANAVVLKVLENQQPSEAEFAAKRDQIRDQLLLGKQQERFGLFVSSLVDEMTQIGQDQEKRRRDQSTDRATAASKESSGVPCPFRAPQAFCCIPRRCPRPAESVISGPPLIAS